MQFNQTVRHTRQRDRVSLTYPSYHNKRMLIFLPGYSIRRTLLLPPSVKSADK